LVFPELDHDGETVIDRRPRSGKIPLDEVTNLGAAAWPDLVEVLAILPEFLRRIFVATFGLLLIRFPHNVFISDSESL
jgi:hypothetical protein